MIFKIAVIVLLIAILFFMGSSIVCLLKGNSDERMVKALSFRVAISIGLFILLLVAAYMGLFEPRGIAFG